jgi:nitrite reductase/ring-hydroxylating ferredoxin subunit
LPDRNTFPDEAGFYIVATADAVRSNQITLVQVNDRSVILTRWQGELLAFSNQCPHASADLAEGYLHRGRITCPDHGYKFDISNGRILWPEDEVCRLKRYVVMEENGTVKVRLT